MNKRIKELAEQAEQAVSWGNPNNYDDYNRAFDEWQEKFAELSVRECAELMYGRDENGNCKDGDVIKKHFGVEE